MAPSMDSAAPQASGSERSGAAVKRSMGPRCGAVLMGLFDLSGCRS